MFPNSSNMGIEIHQNKEAYMAIPYSILRSLSFQKLRVSERAGSERLRLEQPCERAKRYVVYL